MIVASIALLVVAVVLIIVGIAKSAVAPLVISVLCTVAAGGLLYASFLHYRRRTPAGTADPRGPGAYVAPAAPAAPTAAPAPATAAVAPVAATAAVPVANGGAVLPDGWADLNADDAIALVETFSLPELHEARRVEVEGKHRKTVLAAVDDRIDRVVDIRKQTAKN